MVNPSPYLPDIMQALVARVNTTYSTRTDDATKQFTVFFDKGLYSQVAREVYNAPPDAPKFPLCWLVMKFPENRGKDFSIWGEVNCRLILAMPTDNTYTQQQRDDLIYKPFLLPIYDSIIAEVARERRFQFQGSGNIVHTRTLLPYWGGGDVGGQDSDNLFKQKIDAIDISGLKIRLRNDNCFSAADYSVLPPFIYS